MHKMFSSYILRFSGQMLDFNTRKENNYTERLLITTNILL